VINFFNECGISSRGFALKHKLTVVVCGYLSTHRATVLVSMLHYLSSSVAIHNHCQNESRHRPMLCLQNTSD